MRVAVIGPGAVGTVFGGVLAADGHETWLLHHRAAAAERIRREGVTLADDDGETRVDVPATTDAADVAPVDLALVLVRAHQTLDAVTEHAACVGPDTRVLSLQNGVSNHHRLREHLGEARTLSGVTQQGAVLEGPGRVVRTNQGATLLGGADGAFAERVATAFRSAGIDARAVEDPDRYVWKKQVTGGAIKPVGALTRLSNGDLVATDALAPVMEGLVREAAAVATALGHPVDPDEAYADLRESQRGSAHRTSMLQDVAARRKTEIADCNGAVVSFAADAGVDVPYNEVVTALVRGLERSYLDEGDHD